MGRWSALWRGADTSRQPRRESRSTCISRSIFVCSCRPDSQPVPVGDADARPGLRHLGDRVVPGALRLAAGDEQIAASETERLRLAAALGAQQELARLSQREKRNDGVFDVPADAVAVPGDAVLPIAVEVEARRVEDD